MVYINMWIATVASDVLYSSLYFFSETHVDIQLSVKIIHLMLLRTYI